MTSKYDSKTIARFWSKVDKSGDCWEWAAGRGSFGYGRFRALGKTDYAHRVSYGLEYGEIPDGMCVLHKCDNPPCVNPAHIFLGTKADNMADRDAKGRNVKGGNHGQSKLTEEDIPRIRDMLRMGCTQADIAGWFGVHQVTISKINTGYKWSHV